MFKTTLLPNGLRILTSVMPSTRSASIGLFVQAGSRYESDPEGGTFHFIEHLLFKGTSRYETSREISEAVESVGGILNASTDQELTVYWSKVPHSHLNDTIKLLSDMLQTPKFRPDDIEKERGVILEELAMSNDDPDDRAGILIDQVMWPNQPLGRDIGGTPDSVRSISRETLLSHFDRHYHASNTVLAIAGQFEHDTILDLINRELGSWDSGNAVPYPPANDDQEAAHVLVEFRKTDQAHVCLGLRGLSSTHPQRYTLDLLNAILGQGASSRLFMEIREKRGLAYAINSGTSHFSDTGALVVYFAVHPNNAIPAIEATVAELYRLVSDLPEEEVEKAKNMIKGRLHLRMEDTRSVSFWGGTQQSLLNHVFSVEDITDKIDAITAEDIRSLAASLVSSDKMNIAVVGPYSTDAEFHRVLR